MKQLQLKNPYVGTGTGSSNGKWYKGSLHAHSDQAEMYPGSTFHDEDSPRDRGQVLADYEGAGYEFVMLAEQNKYTTSQDAAGLSTVKLTVIPGAELDGRRVDTEQHLSHVNPSDPAFHVELDPKKPKVSLQEIFDLAKDDPVPPLVVQVHPQFPRMGDGREKDILGSYGVDALEVVNSWWMQRPHAFEDSGGKYSPFAFHLWDRLLKESLTKAGKPVWGVAGCCSVKPGDVGKSWIRVWLDNNQSPTPDSLVKAIRKGRFYVSSVSAEADPQGPAGRKNPTVSPGVTIEKIETNGKGVTIETDAERVYAIVDGGPRLTVETRGKSPTNPAPGKTAIFETFTFPDAVRFPDAKSIRFECVAADKKHDNWDQSYEWDNSQKLNRSWTQPLWVPKVTTQGS
ncbi:hypothetical protein [Streptomyces sp. NBC_00539]|uniref:hypothetical protein n=1 Tax=Streptomyces sp. NBC_00539 TaxID=2975770 RepID=UPI002E8064E7|nr:hypothetical protein [Streptomyces sp. NBC_00539]WUC62756.1 hypothetical protein OG861_00095 [Streptomyces sp. NBC_00539]